jgi:hypothetical protein
MATFDCRVEIHAKPHYDERLTVEAEEAGDAARQAIHRAFTDRRIDVRNPPEVTVTVCAA